MLPDMVQHRNIPLSSYSTNRIEQGIVCAPAGSELDPDHSCIQTPLKLRLRVATKVGIDDAVPANTVAMRSLKLQEVIVAVFDVGRRRKVDR
jgi:hypothetical protein